MAVLLAEQSKRSALRRDSGIEGAALFGHGLTLANCRRTETRNAVKGGCSRCLLEATRSQ
jgi:hypothetical protein